MGSGYVIGQLLGFKPMDCIFLGGLLSISSTTIAIKSFEDLGMKGQKFTGLVFGVLVIEDLIAILLLVLLSTIAISQELGGSAMLFSITKLVFFLVLCFIIGILLLPVFLKWTKKWMNDETLLIFSLGLCLLMVFIATQAGFSPELGAFVMGSILAETVSGKKIEHLIKPVKNLFGAIFFVSVGMLIDPALIYANLVPVIVISIFTIVGKFIISFFSTLLSGQSLKTSVQVGSSLAQIGEFSFIIAALGLSLGVTGDFLYPVAVAVSAISTLTTPFLIRYSEPMYITLSRILPVRLVKAIDRYSSGVQTVKTVSEWKVLRKSYLIHGIIFSVLIITVILVSNRFITPFIMSRTDHSITGKVLAGGLLIILNTPFLWALMFRKIKYDVTLKMWQEKRYRGLLILFRLLRIALGGAFLGYMISRSFSYTFAGVIFIAHVVLIGFFFKRIQRMYNWVERIFLSNYHENDSSANEHKEHIYQDLTPWDAHMADLTIPAEWEHSGKSLAELALREKFGVNIALIHRGNKVISTPGKDEKIFPLDHIYLIGTDKQVEKVTDFMQSTEENNSEFSPDEIVLTQVVIDEHSPMLQVSIRNSGIRENSGGLVVGIERRGKRILNPDSFTTFESGDIVWIVGSNKRIQEVFSR